MLAVVKANGYGHGAAIVAPILEKAGADWFGVATVGEHDERQDRLDDELVREAESGSDARVEQRAGVEPLARATHRRRGCGR